MWPQKIGTQFNQVTEEPHSDPDLEQPIEEACTRKLSSSTSMSRSKGKKAAALVPEPVGGAASDEADVQAMTANLTEVYRLYGDQSLGDSRSANIPVREIACASGNLAVR
jgi:hypothetical protein